MNPYKWLSQCMNFDKCKNSKNELCRLLDKYFGCIRQQCGNCEHWMKSNDCPNEKSGLKPSYDSISCKTWVISHSSNASAMEFAKEIYFHPMFEELLPYLKKRFIGLYHQIYF